MRDFSRVFLESLPKRKKPPRQSTIDGYRLILDLHVLPQLGNRLVDSITEADVERLHAALGADSPYQANRLLSVLGQFFRLAEKQEVRPSRSNPTAYVERFPEKARGEKKEVMLTPPQMTQLFSSLEHAQAEGVDLFAVAAIKVLFWTGWRSISEVLKLEWANIDFTTGRAKLLRTKTNDDAEYRSLPNEALAVLEGLPKIQGCPYVFPGRKRRGKPHGHLTTIKGPWKKIRAHAGLDNLEGLGALRVHDLRHNVVSWDVSRGVPLEVAGKNVGHRSRRSTETYAHFAPDALKQAADERANAMRAALEPA